MRRLSNGVITIVGLAVALPLSADACTSILVSRGASTDGSVMITYSADAPFMPRLLHSPGGVHAKDATVEVKGWEDRQVRGRVPQAAKTWNVVGLINENQVSISETTTGGRGELVYPSGQLDYDALMWLVLQRATSAKDAIHLIDQLVHEYGYSSGGETFSIADKDEAWLMELIGKGPGVKGAVWVAARVPDGSIAAHANYSRITTFPLDDPENWLYSQDVVRFAIEKGYYRESAGKPFSFRDAYHPDQSQFSKRAGGGRVWSVYRRVAPSQAFSPDYFRGVDGAEDYPLFIKPDHRLGVADVMALMRDHYEGTPFDMTKGLDAGPFGSPYRFRGLTWNVDGRACMWDRAISTQQAGFVTVSQSRRDLPNAVGGVLWFTPDDAYTSCFTPLYCSAKSLPESYVKGDHNAFSWDSAWWVFNLVSNLTYDRWSRIIPDVQKAQREQEGSLLKMQPVIEKAAAELAKGDENLVRDFLTNYSVSTAEAVFRRWKELCSFILTKHNDGYVNTLNGSPAEVGYSQEWLRKVVSEQPGKFELGKPKAKSGTVEGLH
jgi:dipeptidase